MTKTYEVVIRATITKTYTIEADDDIEANNIVYDIFDLHTEAGIPETYNQEVLSIEEK